MELVMDRFKRLFDANEVERGGSFYLQSKVLRARERIQREVAEWEEQTESVERRVKGWQPKIYEEKVAPPPPPAGEKGK